MAIDTLRWHKLIDEIEHLRSVGMALSQRRFDLDEPSAVPQPGRDPGDPHIQRGEFAAAPRPRSPDVTATTSSSAGRGRAAQTPRAAPTRSLHSRANLVSGARFALLVDRSR